MDTDLRLTRNQYNFLDTITNKHKDWFVYNFGEFTLLQFSLIMQCAVYTQLDKQLLNYIRERYINDYKI